MQKSGCYVECYNGKHRTVIHPPERSLTTRQSKETNNDDVNEASPTTTPMRTGVRKLGSNTSAVSRKVRLRIVSVRVQGKQPGQAVETYALLDNGSDVSLCDDRLIQVLGFSGIRRNST